MNHYCLQRDFSTAEPKKQFNLYMLDTKGVKEAWELIEENISHNNSQEWLMTLAEFKVLRDLINRRVKK